MFSLDSDTVNGVIKGRPAIVQRVQATDFSDLWICTIVVEELVGKQISHINSLRSQRKPVGRECRFLAELIPALSVFQILPYTDEAEALYQSWPAKQKRIGPNDCRIAASAIVAGLTVATCNGKDFIVSGGFFLRYGTIGQKNSYGTLTSTSPTSGSGRNAESTYPAHAVRGI